MTKEQELEAKKIAEALKEKPDVAKISSTFLRITDLLSQHPAEEQARIVRAATIVLDVPIVYDARRGY